MTLHLLNKVVDLWQSTHQLEVVELELRSIVKLHRIFVQCRRSPRTLPAWNNVSHRAMTVCMFGCDRSSDQDSVANLKARHAPPPFSFFRPRIAKFVGEGC